MAGRQVVHRARPFQLSGVLDVLADAGLHPEALEPSNVPTPWDDAGFGPIPVVVPDDEVARAREILSDFEAGDEERARAQARRVGPPLLLAAALFVAGAGWGVVAGASAFWPLGLVLLSLVVIAWTALSGRRIA